MNKEIYLNEVLLQIPRLLGNLNRNPLSSNYGSFDREFWHYKTTDFSCVRKQEALLTLALLYKLKNKKNPYYKNLNILNWINAGLKFWMNLQNKDGSFAEWYPNECSYVATAFTLYAASEVLVELKEYVECKEVVLKTLEKIGNWLIKKKEIQAENQECGAIAGLYNLYLLVGHEKFKQSAEEKTKQLLKKQNREGWFIEYGGADIGYLSLAIDYLAKYYSKSQDKNALRIIEKAFGFIKHFLHPNYTSGGEYGSRNTEYLIPHGFELIKNPEADMIALFIRKALKKKRTIGVRNLDDRYLLYNTYTYLQAYCDAKKIKKMKFLFEKEFEKHFKNAGIFIKNTKKYYALINYFKNSFKIISKIDSNKVLYDSGIEINTGNERLQSCMQKKDLGIDEECIWSEGSFGEIPDTNVTPLKTVGIRGFQMTLGKNEGISLFLKNKLRKLLITGLKKKEGYVWRRGFYFGKEKVSIIDEIEGKIQKIFVNTKSSYNYIPSSRYFGITELNNPLKRIEQQCSKIRIEREFGDKPTIKWSYE